MKTAPSGKDVLSYCYQIGAEAATNNRRNMNKDDRSDIAAYAGYTSWNEIPTGQQQEAQKAFFNGWREEKNNEQSI